MLLCLIMLISNLRFELGYRPKITTLPIFLWFYRSIIDLYDINGNRWYKKLLVKHTWKNAWEEILPWSDIKPVKWIYFFIWLNNGLAGCLLVKLNLLKLNLPYSTPRKIVERWIKKETFTNNYLYNPFWALSFINKWLRSLYKTSVCKNMQKWIEMFIWRVAYMSSLF